MDKDEQWLLIEKYGGEKSEGFFADLMRLKAGEPLAYVIGHTPFLGTTIYLDSHPLIPRPETEFWVEGAITAIRQRQEDLVSERPAAGGFGWGAAGVNESSPPGAADEATESPRSSLKILDLCAGSGCIGVAVAKALPQAHVTLAEIEPAHLSTITLNLKENDITEDRYQVIHSDLFENIRGTFDYILTNPPYIDPALDRAEASVKDFEPHNALYGGADGLELIKKILAEATQHLNAGGILYLEHEPEQVAALKTIAKTNKLTIHTHKDQYDVSRYSTFTVAQ